MTNTTNRKAPTMDCDAKIRPFPNDTEVACEKAAIHDGAHSGVVRDYAYQGSATTIQWREEDRRTFRGDWTHCDESHCILPAGHPRGHAF